MLFPLALTLPLLFAASALALPSLVKRAPTFSFPGDPQFSVGADTLAAALTCPNGNPTNDAPPVLLVHGTGVTGEQSWGDSYVPALSAQNYAPCYITLPNRAMGDMQQLAEYIAYAIHYISSLSNGLPTSIVSHSQGGPNVQWTLQFFPSTRNSTKDFIALSPDLQGIQLFDSSLNKLCSDVDLCTPSLWQQSAGSMYYGALHAKNFAAQVPTTVIWSQFDSVVVPAQENAALPSATVIAVQDLCPFRPTTHVTMTTDAAVFAMARDALNNGGTASLDRLQPYFFDICFRVTGEGMNVDLGKQLSDFADDLINGFILGSPKVNQEPPLEAYARP